MPLFSVIVPQTDDTHLFDNTLASVLRNSDSETDVIVAHDGSYQNPYDLSGEVEFVSAGRDVGLAGLINRGLRKADGEYVAVLRPGVELPDDWQEVVRDAFDSPLVAAVSPLIVYHDDPGKIVAAGVTRGRGNSRKLIGCDKRVAGRVLKHLKPLGPTLWAGFYRRSVLAETGACDEILDESYLDLDLALASRTLGYQCRTAHGCRVSMQRPFPLQKESALAHGTSAHRAFKRHCSDVSTGDRVWSIAGDLLMSVFKPTMFTHALQRFSAGKLKDIDTVFSRRIQRIIDQKKLTAQMATGNAVVAGKIDISDDVYQDYESSSSDRRRSRRSSGRRTSSRRAA